ncbi:MAG: TonB-dependent receptor [Bacteroidota bacterium]|nr:TonB-dependent receptor [Bacteroidota bacterium]
MKRIATLSLLLSIFLCAFLIAGTTGKISGIVTNVQTGERLLGVNVLIVGTTSGASTDPDGFFAIVNVPPGEYSVRASSLGYTAIVQTKVRVIVDQTTELNFRLNEEIVKGEEVVVIAQRPVVQKDVATSVANISSKEIESLPVTTISGVVGLQAGVQAGLVIRGSNNADQTAFIVDGLTLRDERNNKPYSAISLSSVQDIQVQTGGFNAEYGNIRSGVVNVITKDGSPTLYTFSATARLSPPTAKNFGGSIYNSNSYFMRPFLDPAVAFTGTGTGTDPGAWDKWTRQQYRPFVGWNAISQASLADNDPRNDLTPEAAQQLFKYMHRKQGDITKPDYDVDAGFGGPVPFVSSMLGNLRFFASYRQQKSMYMIPLSREAYEDYNGQVKFTSDITTTLKLAVQGMMGQQLGTTDNNSGNSGLMQTAGDIATSLNKANYGDLQIYTNDYYAPSTVKMTSLGGKVTQLLSAETFYEASVNYVGFKYDTNPGRARDTTKRVLFGNGYYVDEEPFGYMQQNNDYFFTPSFTNKYGQSGSRDTSRISNTTVKVDFNSQVNRYNQIKTGVELVLSMNNSNYASVNSVSGSKTVSQWTTYPYRASLYAQDKFEYEGMVANFGVRMDVSNPNGDWYIYNPYDNSLFGGQSLNLDKLLVRTRVEKNVTFSPRLGIAFPITDYAKLFFNYGHFRSMPQPEDLFLVRHDPVSKSVSRIANPNNPLPKTIAYELGYEHSLLEEYLIRVVGYYKNVSDQITQLTVLGSKVNYTVSTPNSYEDIRGFEVTLSRNRGEWITGFLNYTYMARSTGRFGFRQISQSITDQNNYEAIHTDELYQTKPVAQPFARLSVDFFTPADYMQNEVGVGGVGLLNDWRLNMTTNWSSGAYDTWTGNVSSSLPDVRNNVQWKDTYGANIRLSKNFKFGAANVQLFADINNIFNIRNFTGSSDGGYGFTSVDDENSYWQSLHLPKEIVEDRFNYINIPGSDQPGEVRKDGAPYVHIEPVKTLADANYIVSTAIYWDKSTGRYMENKGSGWTEVSSSRMKKILDDKSYIDMPNMDFLVFLNPRDIFWGLKVTFEF